MVRKADIPDHVIDTALRLAAERGWHALSLADIADAARLPLSVVYPLFRSKEAVLAGLVRRVDAAVLAEEEEAGLDVEHESYRDRLFDVLMRRFDALQPHRAALARILRDQPRDPLAALCALGRLRRSMALMLEAARIPTAGLGGALRIRGLTAIYLATLRVWLRDDSLDLAKTMAALDAQLRRVEGFAARRRWRSRGADRDAGTA